MTALSDRRARLLASLYRTFGEGATWTGSVEPVTIRRQAGEAVANFGDSAAVLPTLIIRVRRSEKPDPAKGDQLVIQVDEAVTQVINIIAAPRLELPQALEWLCEAELVCP